MFSEVLSDIVHEDTTWSMNTFYYIHTDFAFDKVCLVSRWNWDFIFLPGWINMKKVAGQEEIFCWSRNLIKFKFMLFVRFFGPQVAKFVLGNRGKDEGI